MFEMSTTSGKGLRILFLGTPEFAVASLRRLVEQGYNVVGVVTAPDKPAGRGLRMQESDVKRYAVAAGLRVLQPEKLRDPEFLEAVKKLEPDLGIVIAFRMMPQVLWSLPRLGTFNLHASLLPQYRGAAPINWAIINGEKTTGLTTFMLNAEIDKGDIVGRVVVDIEAGDTAGTLHDRLMIAGAGLVVNTVDRVAEGGVTPLSQQGIPEDGLHPAPKIFREDCRVDWSWTGGRIVNFVRGLSPYPAAWTEFGDTTLKLFDARFVCDFSGAPHPPKGAPRVFGENSDGLSRLAHGAGELKNALTFPCADGHIEVTDLQPAGKRRMTAKEFLNGLK